MLRYGDLRSSALMQTRINIKQDLITVIIELAESFRVEDVFRENIDRSTPLVTRPDDI